MSAAYDEFNTRKLSCKECPVGLAYNRVVASTGNTTDPTVMVIGEAPGSDEVEKGEPFVGRSGKLLRDVLNRNGYRKENTLITNTMPCRPQGNVYPSDRPVVDACTSRWLWEEVRITRPRFVLIVGGKALMTVMGLGGIMSRRGVWMQLEKDGWNYRARCMATLHPSYVLRAQNMENAAEAMGAFEADIREVALAAGLDTVPVV